MSYDNYIKIPIVLLTDNNISSSTKLLYGLLVLLTYQERYCSDNNSYLSDNNYIKMEFKHKFIRKIFNANKNINNK